MAGGAGSRNNSYYLYTGEYWWSLSPNVFNNSGANDFNVNYSGTLSYYGVDNTHGVRPAIALANDLIVERGTGTSTNPYELVLE